MWDFETDSEVQAELDWIDSFVEREVEPLDTLLGSPYDVTNPENIRRVRPLQKQVKERKLWACHLSADLGGQGYGQVRLALMNEILGRSRFAPVVFGCQAPDSGNAEILARFGTPRQKAKYLAPLLDNEIVSCFSMTEPQGGSDPTMFQTIAKRDGNGWVISGEKWFSSNARYAAFYIVMAVTDPDAPPHKRLTMFIVPASDPGVEIVRDVKCAGERDASHAYVRYNGVRVDDDSLLGGVGEAFHVAQTRLGGGRIHHAMRTIGQARRTLDMMCQRVLSRKTKGEFLSEKQMAQEKIADSWIELEQFRLLVLRTAWLIDKHQDYRKVRKDIAAVKAVMPKVLHDIAARCLQLHGSIGVSEEMPFMDLIAEAFMLGLADGPTEVHKLTVARQLLSGYQPSENVFPNYHIPTREAAVRKRYSGT